jgi:hypothetical protein
VLAAAVFANLLWLLPSIVAEGMHQILKILRFKEQGASDVLHVFHWHLCPKRGVGIPKVRETGPDNDDENANGVQAVSEGCCHKVTQEISILCVARRSET